MTHCCRSELNSQPKKSGLHGSSNCNKVNNQILGFFVKDTFNALFWLQSEHKQKFVPSFVWKQCGFKLDMSILKRWQIWDKQLFSKVYNKIQFDISPEPIMLQSAACTQTEPFPIPLILIQWWVPLRFIEWCFSNWYGDNQKFLSCG